MTTDLMSKIDLSHLELDTTTKLGPAPPLTEIRVYAVGSSKYGDWEYISAGQNETRYDHGGEVLLIAVFEKGYGSTAYVEMAGSSIGREKNYLTEGLCVDGDILTKRCPSDDEQVAFLEYYNLSGFEGGLLKYNNVSRNPPKKLLEIEFTIK